MSKFTNGVVLDTNILLDYFNPERPSSEVSCRAVDLAITSNVPMFYTAHQLRDLFSFTARWLKELERRENGGLTEGASISINETCWGIVSSLEGFSTVVGADFSDVWMAKKLKGAHRDFEDDLVIAAAYRAKADCIITNDEKLAKHSPVACLAPADFVALLEAFEGE